MSAQIFHVVPDKNTRDNHLLAIGSDDYNRIRYRGNRYGQKPGWIHNLERDLFQKQNGTFVSERKENGRIQSPAAAGLRRDVKDCIYFNLHFKSKTFEYNATTYEFKVHGKYVATLDPDKGVISSFSIQHINDKYSRYRLRDLGIRLTSKDGKTFWKFGVEKDYYEYLMAIHGSLENMRKFFKPLFPTIKVEKKREEDDSNQHDYVIIFVCEIRDDVKYPVFPHDRFCTVYGSNPPYAYMSGIFHNYKVEEDPVSETELKSYSYGSSGRFSTEINSLQNIDPERQKYQLGLLLNAGLRNLNVITGFNPLNKKFEYNTFDCSIYLDTSSCKVTLVQIDEHDERTITEATFQELEIEDRFKGGRIRFVPEGKWEVRKLIDYVREHSNESFCVSTEEGLVKPKWTLAFFDKDVVIEKLVGKELLIG